jgi:thiol-disulfide isomerase/thioredoxin
LKYKEFYNIIQSSKYWKDNKGEQIDKDLDYTFIYFWSVSCSYCKEMLPTIQIYYEKIKDQTRVICVHVPLSENDLDESLIEKVINAYNITSPTIFDHNHDLFAIFQTPFLPSLFLIKNNEEIVDKHIGFEGVQEWLLNLSIKYQSILK